VTQSNPHLPLHPLRIATWNIHKGVRGIGSARRLEIHDMLHAVEGFDADIVCLQEVRSHNHKEHAYFERWPDTPQADYLAPEGYTAIYRSNAFTRHGEHGNALLTRWPVVAVQHEDMSDHRLEQRGLLHVVVHAHGHDVHVIVVHLGLIAASRLRQLAQLKTFIGREVPPNCPLFVAGDFNCGDVAVKWSQFAMQNAASKPYAKVNTFPARLPLVQFDHVFARGTPRVAQVVPRGRIWARMSDHLPLIADFELG
jgi:endonuclease/exonuclease/phosphatase family metal-dependent hydrolase